MEAKKKYLIIGIVFMLMVTIGFSAAYWTAQIIGSGKDMVVETDELKIIFTDNSELKSDEVKPGWETSKTFSVENKSGDVYYYDILMENLINTFVNDYLEYKITCTNGSGSSMNEFVPVPKSKEATTEVLLSNITIQDKEKQEYKIEFRYVSNENEDQSDDMGKKIKGNLMIGKHKSSSLVFFEDKFNGVGKRADGSFGDIVSASSKYYEDGNWTEGGNKVYYYAGNATDNWVYFANKYWRIIRMNEDESIRLLYAGTSPDTTEAYIINSGNIGSDGNFMYNHHASNHNNPAYVGYMYSTGSTLSEIRENSTNSPIKTELDTWYATNLQSFDKYISKTAIYCNDRSNDNWSASGMMYYAATQRLTLNAISWGEDASTSQFHPSFKCGNTYLGELHTDSKSDTERKKDMFSYSTVSGGNGALSNVVNGVPGKSIGLMTADEVSYAGGVYGTNNPDAYYYRNSKSGSESEVSATGENNWWTMSPSFFNGDLAYMFEMVGSYNPGLLFESTVDDMYIGVRPVISLKSCVEFEGSGLSSNPYTVKEFADGSSCALAEN